MIYDFRKDRSVFFKGPERRMYYDSFKRHNVASQETFNLQQTSQWEPQLWQHQGDEFATKITLLTSDKNLNVYCSAQQNRSALGLKNAALRADT
jgi:hypothetical protein